MNDAFKAQLLEAVRNTPSPTRGEVTKRRWQLLGGGVLATSALFFLLGGFARGTRSVELVVFTAGLGLVAAAISTHVTSGRKRSMLGHPRPVLVTLSLATMPALALVALAAATLWPEPAAETVATHSTVACAAMTVVEGALPLGLFLFAKRGTDPIHPSITGAALGITAGAWTATMAYLRCPHAQAEHCVAAHVAPVVVLAITGALVGKVLLETRATKRS